MMKVYLLIDMPNETADKDISVQVFEERKHAVKEKAKALKTYLEPYQEELEENEDIYQTLLKAQKALKGRKYQEAIELFESVVICSWIDPYRALYIEETKVK